MGIETITFALSESSSMTTDVMTGAINNIMTVVSNVITTIAGNPVLMTFFCAGLVGVAIGLVKRLKR